MDHNFRNEPTYKSRSEYFYADDYKQSKRKLIRRTSLNRSTEDVKWNVVILYVGDMLSSVDNIDDTKFASRRSSGDAVYIMHELPTRKWKGSMPCDLI